MTYLEKQLTKFEAILEDKSMTDYFGIVNTRDKKLTLYASIKQNIIKLHIHFCKKPPMYDFVYLPLDISRVIASYLPTIIDIYVEILLPYNYPFTQPVWSLCNVLHNITLPPINIEEYFKYLVNNHNQQYERCWTPAISIEKNILDFIQKTNHFDYLLE